MNLIRLIKKVSAVVLIVTMLSTSVFAFSVNLTGVTAPVSNQDQTAGDWTLDMDDDQTKLSTKAGVMAGSRTALVIRTGANMGDSANTAAGEWNGSASAIGAWFDYGANGNVMVDEYDFSFTQGAGFQIRGYASVDTSTGKGTGQFFHAISVDGDNLRINEDREGSSWPLATAITPGDIHTLRVEINNQSSPNFTKFYLDGQLVYTKEGYGDNSKAVTFMLTTPNSEVRLYRFARNVAASSDNVGKRNFCKTFEGMTMTDLWADCIGTPGVDYWVNMGNGHQLSIEAEDAATNYMKLKRTGPGGNGHVRYNVPATENVPKDLNIDFSYWGLGLNQIRLLQANSAVTAMLNIVDNQLVLGTDITNNYTGTVIKDYVSPYDEHRLTISMINGMMAIFLDGEFLKLTDPYDGVLGVPSQIKFYNMGQDWNYTIWGNANRHMYAGINVKAVSTDDDLLINEFEAVNIELSILKNDVAVTSLAPDAVDTTVISGKAKILNLGTDDIDGIIMLAKYIDGVLVDVVRSSEFNVSMGETSDSNVVSLPAGIIEKGAEYKLFAFSGVDAVKPLVNNIVVSQPLDMVETVTAASRVSESDWNLTRIAETIKKANRGEDIVVAALGGSITEGAGVVDKANSYANRVADWWEEKYPGQVTRVNAGVGGTDSFLGVHRMPGQVLAKNPDFTVVDFAVNDNDYDFQDYAYETIVRTILESSDTSSVMMAFFMNTSGTGSTNAQNCEKPIGLHYDIPMVSIRDALQAQVDAGNISWTDVMDDTVHPNEEGHWLASECIVSVLEDVYDAVADGTYVDTTYQIPATTCMNSAKFTDAAIYVSSNQDGAKFGQVITPSFEAGSWAEGYVADYVPSWTNNYGTGWQAKEFNKPITFNVSGKYITLAYRNFTEDKAGVVKVQIDDEAPIYIDSADSDFVQLCHDAYIRDNTKNDGVTLEALSEGSHEVTVTLIPPSDYEAAGITKNTGRTGNFFGLCAVMTSN